MWKRGIAAKLTISWPQAMAAPALMFAHSIIPCVMMTPFGKPVVPEEYMSMH